MIRRLIIRVCKLLLGLAILLALLGAAAWFYPEKFLCTDTGKGATADVILVLGGGAREQRAEHAADLYRDHAAPKILISGAGDDEIYRQILLDHGVPASAIEVEGKSKTTYENALFSGRILYAEKVHRVILVTSWYHSRRALKTFEKLAPEVTFY